MKHSEVLSRYVNTGVEILSKQYDRLTPSLKKSYLRIRSVAGLKEWEFTLLNDNERINYIEKKGKELGLSDIKYLLKYSKNKDLISTKIIEVKGKELVSGNIYDLLGYSENKDDIATKIIEVKGEKLDGSEINHLMTKKYFNIDNIAIKIIETFGEKLNSEKLRIIMQFSKDKDDIARKIIQAKGKKLNIYDITHIIKYSKDKEFIKKRLLQKGIDYKFINYGIVMFNSGNIDEIPLISDNYQSMLQEIKRIKEIMK